MPEGKLILTFIPPLIALLQMREKSKGLPLTEQEVLEIRDKAVVIALPVAEAAKMDAARGYKDLDAENCWEEWQRARVSLPPSN